MMPTFGPHRTFNKSREFARCLIFVGAKKSMISVLSC